MTGRWATASVSLSKIDFGPQYEQAASLIVLLAATKEYSLADSNQGFVYVDPC